VVGVEDEEESMAADRRMGVELAVRVREGQPQELLDVVRAFLLRLDKIEAIDRRWR